ncbi:hypothetical protein EJ06DRAFT_379075 [Trichodelitschia bisporula]|uniref:Uncharacterized protein n=1 Tax=Trichodelitschia bisporula TaxID=703511 RepID=A0A6G1HYP6_9PEZI|nr:hypothetical protein EJ06DRAFT_379075 [Trichodelitschia bisporula]
MCISTTASTTYRLLDPIPPASVAKHDVPVRRSWSRRRTSMLPYIGTIVTQHRHTKPQKPSTSISYVPPKQSNNKNKISPFPSPHPTLTTASRGIQVHQESESIQRQQSPKTQFPRRGSSFLDISFPHHPKEQRQ